MKDGFNTRASMLSCTWFMVRRNCHTWKLKVNSSSPVSLRLIYIDCFINPYLFDYESIADKFLRFFLLNFPKLMSKYLNDE